MLQNLWEIEQKNTLLHKKYVKKKNCYCVPLKMLGFLYISSN